MIADQLSAPRDHRSSVSRWCRKHSVALRVVPIPVILVAVSALHFYQWTAYGRSSWGTGAGFGMFATVDYHSTRFFRCYVHTAAGRYLVTLPDELSHEELMARIMPTENNLSVLARKLLPYRCAIETSHEPRAPAEQPTRGATARLIGPEGTTLSETQLSEIRQIEIEIWSRKLSPANKTITAHLIRQLKLTNEQYSKARSGDVARL